MSQGEMSCIAQLPIGSFNKRIQVRREVMEEPGAGVAEELLAGVDAEWVAVPSVDLSAPAVQ